MNFKRFDPDVLCEISKPKLC